MIPDPAKTLRQGAIAPWSRSSSPYYTQTLEGLGRKYKFSLTTPWKELPKKVRDTILYGSGDEDVKFIYDDGMRTFETKKPFEGVIVNLERRFRETESDWAREDIEKYFTSIPCKACNGYRLKPEALCVKIAEKHIGEVAELSVRHARTWFEELPKRLTPKQNEIGARVLKEVRERLTFLVDVGLEYLTLARASGTLSGGESQRIRLASQIGSGLTGVLYVLDEPSIGLHQRDNARLLETLKRLRDLGNTVIVVEHDEEAIRTADYRRRHRARRRHSRRQDRRQGRRRRHHQGARARSPANIFPASGKSPIPERRKPNPNRQLKIVGARGNNLKNITAEIPLGLFTCVTGVSGGGKSTLHHRHALQGGGAAAERRPRRAGAVRGDQGARAPRQGHRHRSIADRPHAALEPGHLYRRLHADPRMVSRGCPRRARAATSPAASRFNVKGGRCEACQGDGVHQDRDALSARRLRHLRRLQGQALQPRDAGGDVQGEVDRRRARHDGGGRRSSCSRPCPRSARCWRRCARVGLDYIHIGQQATTLSGGEAQRVKLAKELSQARDRPHALHSRRADHGPAFRRRGEAARSAARAGGDRQHRGGDRAQSRRHQDRRLDHRPRPRGRRRAAARSSRPARRSRSRRRRRAIPASF